LLAPIHLYNIAQALEGVKRQANGEDDVHSLEGVVPMNQFGDGVGIVDEKVVVLENKQYHAGRNDAQDEPYLFRSALRRSDFDTREIVNEYGDE
jgi:hypothetical protein